MKCLEVVGRRKLLFVCHTIWTHKLVVIDGDLGQRRRSSGMRNVAVPFLHEERSEGPDVVVAGVGVSEEFQTYGIR